MITNEANTTQTKTIHPPRYWRLRVVLSLAVSLACSPLLAATINAHFFTNRDGLRLHYLEAGAGTRTLVFIPGWLMPAAVFRLQLEALGSEFRVLAFDPRSQGESEIYLGPHGPQQRLSDLEDFLHAAGVRDYVLAGWSLGVLEVLDFIEQVPQIGLRGLILIDNSVGEGTPPPPRTGKRNEKLSDPKQREAYLAGFCRSIFASPPPPDIATSVLRSALRVPADAARQLLAQPYPRAYWREIVAKQEVPVLYVIRPRLREQGEALSRRKGALAQVELFETAGHTLFVDDAPRFNALVSRFVRSAFPPTADDARSVRNVPPSY